MAKERVTIAAKTADEHGSLSDPTNPLFNYNSLSIVDLLEARNFRHAELTGLKGVVGTAVGRYFIRKGDSYPGVKPVVKGKGPKTLETTEIRHYSWPCVIVFVESWIGESEFAHDKTPIRNLIPDRIVLPDSRTVPVCVLEAPKAIYSSECNPNPVMPGNFIGGGYPVLCEVQEQEHFASVGCLLTDGHTVYALTNRHVAGNPGEAIYALLEGKKQPIGRSSDKQLGRLTFESVYEGWSGKNVFLNLDIGLIELSDVTKWVPQVYGIGTLGPVADLSTGNISLSLINAGVRAYGAVSREMEGCIYALFYRYGEMGGFDYVSDILIGGRDGKPLNTHHGDSGTLWVLDPVKGVESGPLSTYRPLAVQWGGQVFTDSEGKLQKSFALGTLLSTVCHKLEVTPVRDWGFELPEYWGTFGHFTIANIACSIAGTANSKVRQFFKNNLKNITFQLDDITVAGTGGLSKGAFVPLADVPDLVWKMPSGDGSRGPRGRNPEGPNHFADMDQAPPDGSPDLLTLCKSDDSNVSPDVWIDYANKFPAKTENKTAAYDMGLLPFRVWQLYYAMVDALNGKGKEKDRKVAFLCAAGTLAHYIGDSCQPLHISYLHHGDPDNFVTKTVNHVRGKKAGTSEEVNVSQNVHEDYEQTMFRNDTGETVKTRLSAVVDGYRPESLIKGGKAAAIATVAGMQSTFETIAPRDIVDAYDDGLRSELSKGDLLSMLWEKFGDKTVDVMAEGSKLLALLWESAWKEGSSDKAFADLSACDQGDLSEYYDKKTNLTSYRLTEIKPHLKP
jgi:hypothetical protein